MAGAAFAIVYALFAWWFSTGLVFLLIRRFAGAPARLLVLAAAVIPVSLLGLAFSRNDMSATGAHLAFTSAIALWGVQEIAFLTGFITGPRAKACPRDARGVRRVGYAILAIAYHEIALIVSGGTVAALTLWSSNRTALITFAVLWLMRVSAKLNLFIGVPELHDSMMPEPLVHLRSYFRRGRTGHCFAIAVTLSLLGLGWLTTAAVFATTTGLAAGLWLTAALLALAILEHAFMVLPLPVERLWAWSQPRADRPI